MDDITVIEPVTGINQDYHHLKESGSCVLVLTVDAPTVHVWLNGVEFHIPTGKPVQVPRAVGDFLLAQYHFGCRLLETSSPEEEIAPATTATQAEEAAAEEAEELAVEQAEGRPRGRRRTT